MTGAVPAPRRGESRRAGRMATNAENTDWGRALEGSLRKKLRSQGMRTDFMPGHAPEVERPGGPEAVAPRPAPPSPAESGVSPPPAAPGLLISAPAASGEVAPVSALQLAGAPDAGSPRGTTSAEMVVDQLRRSLSRADEERALAVLRGGGGSGGGAALPALAVVVVLVSAAVSFALAGRTGPDARLALAPGFGPPEETSTTAVASPRATPDDRSTPAPGDGPVGGEAGPVFHAGAARAKTEWTDLGGPLVDLDRCPPRTGAGP